MNLLTLVIFVANYAIYVAFGETSTVNSPVQVNSPAAATIAPTSTVSDAPPASSTVPQTSKKVKFQAKAKFQLTGKTFTEDLKNESSSAYKETRNEIEEAIESALKTKATLKEATFTSGSIIATIVVVFEEELETSDAVPSNFVELFKKVIESGNLGNFTVNSTYISIDETFEVGVTVTGFKVKDDDCEKNCCSGDGIINKEITQYRTCSADVNSKCENVITKRNVLCSIADCCSSASDLLMSPLTTLLALALAFLIIG